MLKTMYLITFLSVVLFNSKTSFGQSLKKELGICGKTANAIFSIDPKLDPKLSSPYLDEIEYCDNGRYEHEANFVIFLYNSKDKLVYDKYVYLNPMTFAEKMDPKNPSKFKMVKVSKGLNSRIVKFPINKEMGDVVAYKIKSLNDKKTYDMKKIKW